MILARNKKLTANQFAKIVVSQFGDETCDWRGWLDSEERLTSKEESDIDFAIEHQSRRVKKLLITPDLPITWI